MPDNWTDLGRALIAADSAGVPSKAMIENFRADFERLARETLRLQRTRRSSRQMFDGGTILDDELAGVGDKVDLREPTFKPRHSRKPKGDHHGRKAKA